MVSVGTHGILTQIQISQNLGAGVNLFLLIEITGFVIAKCTFKLSRLKNTHEPGTQSRKCAILLYTGRSCQN